MIDIKEISAGDWLAIGIGLLSLFVSIIVLYITYQTWKLKVGQNVRASYGITSSIEADGPYISTVIIENLKDKDLIIFGLFLKYGANVYIDLLDIDSNYDKYHHIIPPLSTTVFELGAPIYYTAHAFEVDLTKILRNDFHKGQIILETNHGKVVAKKFKKGWHPIAQSFKNYATLYVKPVRFYTSDSVPFAHKQSQQYVDYSSIEKTTNFVVKIKLDSGRLCDFKISSSHNYVLFQNLKFTTEILQSADALKKFLLQSRDKGLISFQEIIEIKDVQEIIAKDKSKLFPCPDKDNIVEPMNAFQYYFVWQIKTWIDKIINPRFPSKLFSFYCFLGLKTNPNKRRKTKNKNSNNCHK